ncbi:MAG: diguanylate cyclase [Treponema sp.]|nr:diguanylate cyclase [Treponema sp.]
MEFKVFRRILYLVLFFLVCFIALCSYKSSLWTVTSVMERIVEYSPGWTIVEDEHTDACGTIAIERVFTEKEINSINGGATLFFRTRNNKVKVFVNSKEVYSFGYYGKKYVGSESGMSPHFIRLDKLPGNKKVHIGFSPSFESDKFVQKIITPTIYFGTKFACMKSYLTDCLPNFILSLLILIVGLSGLTIAIGFWLSKREYVRDSFYWSFFVIVFGIGFLIETGMLDFFTHNAFFFSFLSTFILAITPGMLIIYIEESKALVFSKKLFSVLKILCIVNAFVVCISAFITSIPFYFIRVYINFAHIFMLFFFIESVITVDGYNGKMLLKNLVFVIACVAVIADLILWMLPPYNLDMYKISRPFFFLFITVSRVFVINSYGSSQAYSVRNEVYEDLLGKDSLTGTKTKISFWKAQNEILYLNKAKLDKYSLVLFEITNLKNINEALGYEKGDYALKILASVIKKNFLDVDLYRLDGSCFGLILKNETKENILNKIEKIENSILKYDSDSNNTIFVCYAINVYDSVVHESFEKFLMETKGILCVNRMNKIKKFYKVQ